MSGAAGRQPSVMEGDIATRNGSRPASIGGTDGHDSQYGDH